jgi:inorganic pyrophosphatase
MSAIASAFKTMASVAKPALASRQFTARAAPALRASAFQRPNRRAFVSATPFALAKYGSEKKGEYPSMDFRIFFNADGKPVSPWHGVPLKNEDGTMNFICEIPKETKAKMEVATDEEMTPIKQDTKKGKLRDYPYNINWNYGMLPQTWEDPGHEHPEMKVMGDNDPVDVVEIGSAALEMGSVTPVKPVGVYAMIDDGELDWKVIAISANDPKAATSRTWRSTSRGSSRRFACGSGTTRPPTASPRTSSDSTISAWTRRTPWASSRKPRGSTTSSCRASAKTPRGSASSEKKEDTGCEEQPGRRSEVD